MGKKKKKKKTDKKRENHEKSITNHIYGGAKSASKPVSHLQDC